ncbi:MAG: NADH-quinone oxidoreductase subunit NuoH [Bacteroidota bacterium]
MKKRARVAAFGRSVTALAGGLLAAGLLPAALAVAATHDLAPAPVLAADAWVRDVRPTKLERGDALVVELADATPRGPAIIVLTPHVAAAGAVGRTAASAGPPAPLVLRARALGDGRVVADVDAHVEARVGRDVVWSETAVEVALTDTGHGDIWAATGGHRVWRTRPGDETAFVFFPGTLRGFAARVAATHQRRIAGVAVPAGLLAGAIMVGVALLVLLLVAPFTGLLVVWERKIAGRMQSRFGPNRVGPRGWLQWLADGIKLIMKEDLIPTAADALLFRLSPYLMWMGIFATLVVLPLSQFAIVADLNIGLLYLTSVTTFTVIGVIMGGWASNSKWSLLGGMRSAAQIISYELPASIALLSVVVLAGTLSPQAIVRAQGGLPTEWFVFRTPFTYVAFFIFFISALAEGNRTPFDLPEAESELVAGYHTEYSGFRWSIFQLGEWTNIYVVGGITATVFLGGWNVPLVPPDAVAGSALWQGLSLGVMLAKVVVLSFVIIWIRWTLPRFRLDQLMNLCWKWLLPASFAAFVASAAWAWATADAPRIDRLARWATFLVGGVGVGAAFLGRLLRTFRRTRLLHVGERQFTLPFVERHLEKR